MKRHHSCTVKFELLICLHGGNWNKQVG